MHTSSRFWVIVFIKFILINSILRLLSVPSNWIWNFDSNVDIIVILVERYNYQNGRVGEIFLEGPIGEKLSALSRNSVDLVPKETRIFTGDGIRPYERWECHRIEPLEPHIRNRAIERVRSLPLNIKQPPKCNIQLT